MSKNFHDLADMAVHWEQAHNRVYSYVGGKLRLKVIYYLNIYIIEPIKYLVLIHKATETKYLFNFLNLFHLEECNHAGALLEGLN